jgi:hypothetical protein
MIKPTIYIIGAGISGLTAALLLSEKGYDVKLYESSKIAGGRLRSFHDESLDAVIDNGNHLVLEANRSTIGLFKKLNVLESFNKFADGRFSFFDIATKSGFETESLSLKRIPGISAIDYLKLLKLLLPVKQTVAEAFSSEGALFKNFVDNISRSMLNTSSYAASAKMLRNLLVKIAVTPNALDHYYPKKNWADALIEPLLLELRKRKVEVQYNKSLKRLGFLDGKVSEMIFNDGSEVLRHSDSVVLAVPALVAANLVDGLEVPQNYNPILNVHFKFEHSLPPQLFALLNSSVDWVFVKPGIISTTSSDASVELVKMPEAELAAKVWADVAEYLNLKKLKQLPYRIIVEKRATFACDTENLKHRPNNDTKYKNLFLSGDYTSSYLPATIEAAIQSAEKAVRFIQFQSVK